MTNDKNGGEPRETADEQPEETGPEPARTQSHRAPTKQAVRARRRILIGGLLLAVVAAVFLWNRPDDPQELLAEGLEAHRRGEIATAGDRYRAVLEVDPENVAANYNLGLLAHTAGDTNAAADYYFEALRVNPRHVQALFNMAIITEGGDQPEAAEAFYRRVIELDPDEATAHLNLGFLLHDRLGRTEEGRQHLRRAVELAPGLASRVPDQLLQPPAPPPEPASPPAAG